jgi:hypothetical protein
MFFAQTPRQTRLGGAADGTPRHRWDAAPLMYAACGGHRQSRPRNP